MYGNPLVVTFPDRPEREARSSQQFECQRAATNLANLLRQDAEIFLQIEQEVDERARRIFG
jgi:hypothetical protein